MQQKTKGNGTRPIRASVTISLVSDARGGPFVYWDDLEDSCQKAAGIGFDAVELFLPSAEAVNAATLQRTLDANNLCLSALGTGAGAVLHQLDLSATEAALRKKALGFVLPLIDLAGEFEAAVIIGSMQGSVRKGEGRKVISAQLGDSLKLLAKHAEDKGVVVLLEPLNRYESNLFNRLAEAMEFVDSLEVGNVKLLADLFHMNIEEQSIGAALRKAAGHLGHIHFVDSNRRPAGLGHIDFREVGSALKEIGYQGYVSAEAFPYPDSQQAAQQTIDTYRKYIC